MIPCERDVNGINLCMWTFGEAVRVEVEAIRHDLGLTALPCELSVSLDVPESPSAWLAALECPHGIIYWVEPTPETAAVWERENSYGQG